VMDFRPVRQQQRHHFDVPDLAGGHKRREAILKSPADNVNRFR
jgi:hypothetical protein